LGRVRHGTKEAAGGGREARYFAHQGFGSLVDCRPE
jgi:hypothetical protein